jgi:hypothetical protein
MTEAYNPKFGARFGREVARNVLGLVKAQQAAAFALIFEETGVTLSPFKEFNRSVHKQVDAPCFTAYRRRARRIAQDDGGMLASIPVFGLISTVEGANEDEAQELCELYMQAVDSMVRSAADTDLFANLPYAVSVVEITEHIYYDNAPLGTRYRQAVEGVLEIGLLEA